MDLFLIEIIERTVRQEENFKIVKSNLPDTYSDDDDVVGDGLTSKANTSSSTTTTTTTTTTELSCLQKIGVLSSHKYTVGFFFDT